MFGLIRKPQLIATLRANFGLSKFCTTSEPPRRLEKSINTVTLLGRVGANPQLRGTETSPVVTFSLATHFNYKVDDGDWAQRTDWHQIAVFKPDLREVTMNYITKGKRVLLYGKITYGEIVDRDGNTRPTVSIVADDITFFH